MLWSRAAIQRPVWLIANQENGRMEVLKVHFGNAEEALPVFSFEEEAEAFLRLEVPEAGWRVRETTTEELVSLLYGLCEGVERVVLDPLLPSKVGGDALISLVSLDRERFLRGLLSDHRVGETAGETVPAEVAQ